MVKPSTLARAPLDGSASELGRGAERDERGLPHQLANLVQAVNGNLELLANSVVDEPASRYLANARSAARQLTEITIELQGKR